MLKSDYLMKDISLIKHASGAPGLRLFGIGPDFKPIQGLEKLQVLFNQNTLWAKDRTISQIQKMLSNSNVIITLWSKHNLVGFGRATTDEVYRAVLWDIVVADELQRQGLGRQVVEALLANPKIKQVERVYLMTTHSSKFYNQLGFQSCEHQNLLIKSTNIDN